MDWQVALSAALLGVVEGITEFLPISSTGHLILLVDALGFREPPGRVFEVVIQFGAILGVCWVYRERLKEMLLYPLQASNRKLIVNLFIAFLPAAVIGFLAHSFIKGYLFNSVVVSIALVVGGIAIIVIERSVGPGPVRDLDNVPAKRAFLIGLFQTAAMVPGTSRSAATIMGGRILGLSRGVAAEFSFLLAIPTMLAASGYDLYKNAATLDFQGSATLIIGFGCALVTAILTVRWLVAFVSRHSFEAFGYYRIALGCILLLSWLVVR
jgi:undecaprenyl-diphosphatase